jgi:hypothetical protein
MNTPSDTSTGSSFDMEPDPYRELSDYTVGWDLSEIMSAPQRTEGADNSSSGAYFAGRRIKMEASQPDSFPEPRTFPTGWDLSQMETGQAASDIVIPQDGYSIDWMHISIKSSSVNPVDLDLSQ